jgi:hypothetical protein
MSFDRHHDRVQQKSVQKPDPAGIAGEYGNLPRLLAYGTGRVMQARTALTRAGIELSGPHTGRFTTGDFSAEVLLEPGDVIRLSCAAAIAEAPRILLERCAGMPGNVRFATAANHGRQLLADTRVNGVAHLPESLRRIRVGFAQALALQAIDPPEAIPATSTSDALREAIRDAGWPKEDAVEAPDGYELHVLLEGTRSTVRVTAGPGSALAQRTLLHQLPDGEAGRAVAHQALACNARLRGCRLALASGRLRVESQLHEAQLDGEWLSFTVRAVASVARSLEPVLQLLAQEPVFARAYTDMFDTGPEAS